MTANLRHMTGGAALAEMINLYEPGPMFGMGGFQLLPFYNGARILGIKHVLVNDERAGAFAADAYARVSGRPGLCDGTFGPGATNLVTGLIESLNAGIPLIVLVGEGHREHAGKNMTQEAAQERILRPAVKEYLRIEWAQRIPEIVRRAYAVATSGRPGPVIVALPEDIAHEEVEFDLDDFWAEEAAKSSPRLRSRGDAAALEAAAELISSAARPVILVGGGVHLSGAYESLGRFATTVDAPVAHTMSGKGSIACVDRRSVGVFGRYSRYANELIHKSDLLIVIGCKLGEIATKRYSIIPQDVPLIHIETDPSEIGRWARTTVGIAADADLALHDLEALLAERSGSDRSEYWREIKTLRDKWLEEAAPKYASADEPIHMARLLGELNEVLPSNSVVVADGGFASHWAGLLYDTKAAGRGFVSDRGFASIGYGLPGAIGAALAKPAGPVVGITGDGGFNMSAGELETAVRERLDLVLIVVNNAASGYVKALQHAVYGAGNYESSDLSDIDYSRLAEAYGCRGIRVDRPDALAGAIHSALTESGRPVLIDVAVTRDPSRMLPGVDSRTLKVDPGDRPA